ncbi:P-loop containing nucleoside triphosphate hydrolase protein [Aspergillus multicolor]|uniref:P-loop containing nucleoside triphosphate hydrolase protein n=1 Tax=Aspergillus multicolor TaxID=41759 RepID=UPI003CCCA353
MASIPEDAALRQLQQEQSKLLDKIDELRTIGVGGLVELPQLIVCGNQSSGKSSVLEAISRVRFPAKSNVCTRFATEVILRRSQHSKIKIAIEPGPSRVDEAEIKRLRAFTHEGLSHGGNLPALIEEAKECMGISESVNSGFSDDTLKIEISGPDKPELTLVDLPGLYYSTSQQQGSEGIRIVRSLTEKYMKNSRSIILAVVSAKTDYHLQEVLNMAESFDKKRERTLGIITQPDILEANSDEEESYLAFIRNEKIHLQLGWHALRNRSFETRNVTDDERDEQETEFFNQGKWATVSRENVGVESLRRRLSSVLLKHIQRNLPGLIADIQRKISEREQKLAKLGSPRSTLQQQRGFLLGISSGFERITAQALNGMYADSFFAGLGDKTRVKDDNSLLRAVVRQLNEYFAEAMTIRGSRRTIRDGGSGNNAPVAASNENPYMEDWTPEIVRRHALKSEVEDLARRSRGIELPGQANQLLVGVLFRDQSQPWEDLAKMHLLRTWDAVRYFVSLALRHLTNEHTSSLITEDLLEPELEKMKQKLLDKLEELTAFLNQIQKARTARLLQSLKSALGHVDSDDDTDADSDDDDDDDGDDDDEDYEASYRMREIRRAIADLETTSDDFAAGEIVDQMQAYYDIAIVTFVDNVATLAIENCLLEPLQHIFTSQTINGMDESQIHELAAEPSFVNKERMRLSKELDKLRAGMRTFNVFRPPQPPLGSLPSSNSAAKVSKNTSSKPNSESSSSVSSLGKKPVPILPASLDAPAGAQSKSPTANEPGTAASIGVSAHTRAATSIPSVGATSQPVSGQTAGKATSPAKAAKDKTREPLSRTTSPAPTPASDSLFANAKPSSLFGASYKNPTPPTSTGLFGTPRPAATSLPPPKPAFTLSANDSTFGRDSFLGDKSTSTDSSAGFGSFGSSPATNPSTPAFGQSMYSSSGPGGSGNSLFGSPATRGNNGFGGPSFTNPPTSKFGSSTQKVPWSDAPSTKGHNR